MKRIFLTTMLIVTACLSSSATKQVAKGDTHTTFGNYLIEKAAGQVTLNGKALDAFIITYDNSDTRVTVAIEKTGKCKKYYVLSDKLSVQYVCNTQYFGIERLGKELEKEGYKTSDIFLNRQQYFHQRVLSAGNNGDLDNSKLIAAYFPLLMNNENPLAALK
jgi:hypothetical protein